MVWFVGNSWMGLDWMRIMPKEPKDGLSDTVRVSYATLYPFSLYYDYQNFYQAWTEYSSDWMMMAEILNFSVKDLLSYCGYHRVEKMMFGEEIKNIIACERTERKERHEKLERWVQRLEMVAFGHVSLSYYGLLQARRMLQQAFNCDVYKVKEENGFFLICWKDRPLFSVSAWRYRSVHGSALGAKEVNATRLNLAWAHETSHVPEEVKSHWSRHIPEGASLEAVDFKRIISGEFHAGWEKALPDLGT